MKPEPLDDPGANQKPATAVARPIATPARATIKGELHEAAPVTSAEAVASDVPATANAKYKAPRVFTRQDLCHTKPKVLLYLFHGHHETCDCP